MMHGYGASGDDLFPLVKPWANENLSVWAPNAPIPMGFGFAWFELSDDRSDRSRRLQEAGESIYVTLKSYIAKHGFTNIILGGFSQGAMLALHVMANFEKKWPVLAYGGGFFSGGRFNLEGANICMVHGAIDDVVEPHYCTDSMLTLGQMGANVQGYIRPYVSHSIDLEGAKIGRQFVSNCIKGNV